MGPKEYNIENVTHYPHLATSQSISFVADGGIAHGSNDQRFSRWTLRILTFVSSGCKEVVPKQSIAEN